MLALSQGGTASLGDSLRQHNPMQPESTATASSTNGSCARSVPPSPGRLFLASALDRPYTTTSATCTAVTDRISLTSDHLAGAFIDVSDDDLDGSSVTVPHRSHGGVQQSVNTSCFSGSGSVVVNKIIPPAMEVRMAALETKFDRFFDRVTNTHDTAPPAPATVVRPPTPPPRWEAPPSARNDVTDNSKNLLLRQIAELAGCPLRELNECRQLPSMFGDSTETGHEPEVRLGASRITQQMQQFINAALRDTPCATTICKSGDTWSEEDLCKLPLPGISALTKQGMLLNRKNAAMSVERCFLSGDSLGTKQAEVAEKLLGSITDHNLAALETDCAATTAAQSHVEVTSIAIINKLFDLFEEDDRPTVAAEVRPLLARLNAYVLSASYHNVRAAANVKLIWHDWHLKDYKDHAVQHLRVMPYDDNRVLPGKRTDCRHRY